MLVNFDRSNYFTLKGGGSNLPSISFEYFLIIKTVI